MFLVCRCQDNVKMSGILLQETNKACCIEDVRNPNVQRLIGTETQTHAEEPVYTYTHTETRKPTHTEVFTHRSFFNTNMFTYIYILHTTTF